MCLLHGLRDMCIIRLGLLALNRLGCKVVDILIGSVCNIGWCMIMVFVNVFLLVMVI